MPHLAVTGFASLSKRVCRSNWFPMASRAVATASTPTPGRTLRVAAAQMCASDDRNSNFEICSNLVRRAAAMGAQLCCLPECFHFIGGGDTGLKSIDVAEPLEGPALAKYRQLAADAGLWLSLGGFQEADADSGGSRVFNTHVLIDETGDIQSVYRKLHLFDYPKANLMESSFTTAGSAADVVTCKLGDFVMGPTTCYDLRFPSLYQLLTRMGANVMLVPSAFTLRTGMAHWHTLLRARAIETQSYVIAAAQGGTHNAKRESYGHALVIDPWGNIVAETGEVSASEGGLAVADLDLTVLDSIRERMPVETHLRNDIYGNMLASFSAAAGAESKSL